MKKACPFTHTVAANNILRDKNYHFPNYETQ